MLCSRLGKRAQPRATDLGVVSMEASVPDSIKLGGVTPHGSKGVAQPSPHGRYAAPDPEIFGREPTRFSCDHQLWSLMRDRQAVAKYQHRSGGVPSWHSAAPAVPIAPQQPAQEPLLARRQRPPAQLAVPVLIHPAEQVIAVHAPHQCPELRPLAAAGPYACLLDQDRLAGERAHEPDRGGEAVPEPDAVLGGVAVDADPVDVPAAGPVSAGDAARRWAALMPEQPADRPDPGDVPRLLPGEQVVQVPPRFHEQPGRGESGAVRRKRKLAVLVQRQRPARRAAPRVPVAVHLVPEREADPEPEAAQLVSVPAQVAVEVASGDLSRRDDEIPLRGAGPLQDPVRVSDQDRHQAVPVDCFQGREGRGLHQRGVGDGEAERQGVLNPRRASRVPRHALVKDPEQRRVMRLGEPGGAAEPGHGGGERYDRPGAGADPFHRLLLVPENICTVMLMSRSPLPSLASAWSTYGSAGWDVHSMMIWPLARADTGSQIIASSTAAAPQRTLRCDEDAALRPPRPDRTDQL